MSRGVFDYVESKGAKFADPADAAGALIKIASDPSINGMIKKESSSCSDCSALTIRFRQVSRGGPSG